MIKQILVLFLFCFTQIAIALDGQSYISPRNDYKQIKALMQEGQFQEAIDKSETVIKQLKQHLEGAENEIDLRDCLTDYFQFNSLLNRGYDALLAIDLESGTKKYDSALEIKQASSMVNIARTVKKAVEPYPSLQKDLISASTQMYSASTIMLKLGQDKEAKEYIKESSAMLENLIGNSDDWQAHSKYFQSKLLENYVIYKDDWKLFAEKTGDLIESYKDTDWVFRQAMSLPSEVPNFYQTLDSFRLYGYYKLLESRLSNSPSKRSLDDLYYKLGYTAVFLGLYDEADMWFSIYLERDPNSESANIIREVLASCRAENWKNIDKLLLISSENTPIVNESLNKKNDLPKNLNETPQQNKDTLPESKLPTEDPVLTDSNAISVQVVPEPNLHSLPNSFSGKYKYFISFSILCLVFFLFLGRKVIRGVK